MPTTRQAVSLLSGGLDSAAALALAIAEGWQPVLALTFDYGQRAAAAERRHAARIAAHYGIQHRVVALPWFREMGRGGGLLRHGGELPAPTLSQLDDSAFTEASAQAVWVPNRNGVLLEIAAGIAEDAGAHGIVVGFNREEAATFPDNSEEYLEALTAALRFSTSNGVRVVSPTVRLSKPEIVARLKPLDFPFSLLWSCYQDAAVMCGRCESCMRLKRALSSQGVSKDVSFQDDSLS